MQSPFMSTHGTNLKSILASFNDAQSSSDRSKVLKQLKNAIIGHAEKKDDFVRFGGIETLQACLRLLSSSKKSQDLNGSSGSNNIRVVLSDDEELRYQAVTICGSLAHGMSISQ